MPAQMTIRHHPLHILRTPNLQNMRFCMRGVILGVSTSGEVGVRLEILQMTCCHHLHTCMLKSFTTILVRTDREVKSQSSPFYVIGVPLRYRRYQSCFCAVGFSSHLQSDYVCVCVCVCVYEVGGLAVMSSLGRKRRRRRDIQKRVYPLVGCVLFGQDDIPWIEIPALAYYSQYGITHRSHVFVLSMSWVMMYIDTFYPR